MVIALTGKKQSGKSTAAEYIAKRYNAERVNFKDGLIQELKERFPNTLQVIIRTLEKANYDGMKPWTIDRLFNEKPDIVRSLLQEYGTNVRREDDPLYWVSKWEGSVGIKTVVCDDVRFLNEAEAVKKKGGIIIRIKRNGLESTDTHLSETQMDLIEPDFTLTVETGDIEGLYRAIDEVIKNSYGENLS